MAEESFRRTFEEWRGLDLRQTALTREPGSFQSINNWIRGKAGSLRKRNGYQELGQVMAFRGFHRYAYAVPDGGNQEELIGINYQPWKLSLATFTITPPGGVNLKYTAYWEETSPGNYEYRFRLFNGTTPYVIDGALEYVAGTYSLLDLMEKIDALAGFSITVNVPFARVNGAVNIPASVGTTAITVDAGHNLAVDTYIDVKDSGANLTGATWFYIYATTGTSLTVPRWPTQAVDLADNTVLGPLIAPVSTLGLRTTSTTATTISFYYWEPIRISWTDEYRPQFINPNNTSPCNFLNISNIAVVTLPNATGDTDTMITDSSNTPSYILDQPYVTNKPLKYDSQNCYRLGIGIDPKTASSPGVGSIPAGTYKYKFLYKMQDQVGNILRSIPYDAGTVTLAGAGIVNLTGTAYVSTPEFHTCSKGAYVAGAQVAVNTITVDTNGTVGWSRPNIDVGDYVLFRESTVSPPRLTRRLVTAVVRSAAPYSITIDGAAVSLDDNEPISVNLSIEVYRTETQGFTYYLAGEYATPPYFTTVADDILDTALGFELEEPLEGEDPYFPPRATCLCEHQGRLVLSGDTNYPNTVYYSLPNSVEQFNAGFAAFDVPSKETGQVKAVVSDSSNQLAVFKDSSYYSIEGDLSTGYLNNNTVSEFDFGVSSQSSIQKTPRGYIGVGNAGMFEFKDGQIIEPHIELRAAFTDTAYNFSAARGVWISTMRQYRFMSSNVNYIVDFTRMPIFVSTATWPVFSSRMTAVEFDKKVFLSSFQGSRVVVEISPILDSNSVWRAPVQNRYLDAGVHMEQIALEIPADTMGEPSINKYFVRLKLFSLYTVEEEALYYSNGIEVKVYPGLVQGALLGKTLAATLDYEFTAATTTTSEEKLPSLKAAGLGFRMIDLEEYAGSPHLTGYEFVANLPYQKRDNK